MSAKNIESDNLNFWIPSLIEKDWRDAIENSSGTEKEILIIQKRAVALLKNINNTEVTFARLAWLNMWTKAFNILEGILCALPKNSLFVLRMLERASFEQNLQIMTIMEPFLEIYDQPEKENKATIAADILKEPEMEAIRRLEAYAAWSIWNDYRLYEGIINPENLDAAWDADPAAKIMQDPERLKDFESIYGQIDIETDKKTLKKGRVQQQDEGQYRLHRFRMWLEDPVLKPWYEKLKENKFLTFFSLFGEKKKSVKQSLDERGLTFGYSIFSRGSMAIHGSTMEQFIYLGEDKAIPLIRAGDDDIECNAIKVGKKCNQIIVLLGVLSKRLWPQEPSSSTKEAEKKDKGVIKS